MLSLAVVTAGLVATPSAHAAIPQVFTKTATPITCTVQASGQRFCSGQITSWDGIPLDVNVGFPPDGTADAAWPVIGIYHGWGGSKLSLLGAEAQRALTRGYAVFTMTDRGWGDSCGAAMRTDARCAGGYIHLMHNAYEVRDAHYALGQLADDGVIDPQRIGATGGSYGGGMAIALGALRNRTMIGGSLVPWTSPLGKPMSIAATVPEFTWSDIAYALTPNGSNLDYIADAAYLSGGHRVGVQKQSWNASLYLAGQFFGYYAPLGSDPAADIMGWKALTDTGGPFDTNPAAASMVSELTANHSASYIEDSIAPAKEGWNVRLRATQTAVAPSMRTQIGLTVAFI